MTRIQRPNLLNYCTRTTRLAQAIICGLLWLPAGAASAQGRLERVQGQYITLVTDLPASPELNQLVNIFDAAVPQWCEAFNIPLNDVRDWKVEAFWMRARERFIASGDLPNHIPNFPYGFQWGNRLWVSEQDTEYYNRHLLLHEGTHWFMFRKYGANGPPWLMEGLAEWYGTHRWDGNKLEMGIIPQSKYDVPGWGRISLVQEQLEGGIGPSLETVLRYGTSAHQRADAYAWSWAVVLFLKHHPDTSEAFRGILQQKMRPDLTQTRWLFRRLHSRWPSIRASWNLFLSDLEYGFQLETPWPTLSQGTERATLRQLTVESRASWQPSGIFVGKGDTIECLAEGKMELAREPDSWECYAEGVTLEYYGGHAAGRLMCAIVPKIASEPDSAIAIDPTGIGASASFRADQSGELLFRVNEPNSLLRDNVGSLKLRVSVTSESQP